MKLAMTADELHRFLAEEFPQVAGKVRISEIAPGSVRVRLQVDSGMLRPGGTVSGPSMFMLADLAVYLLVLSASGPKALAVTTNCSIDFMRKPGFGDLEAVARLLKLGRKLAFGDVLIHSVGGGDPVARASLTYALPD